MTTPNAINDAFNTIEKTADDDDVLLGNVLFNNGNGADNDPDSDVLTVTAVNGIGTAVGSQITLTSGALLTLNSDGLFEYDLDGAFRALNTGETDTDSFTYTIDDGNGGTDTATVTVTIRGITNPANDDFANAFVLTGLTATATGSGVGATGEVGEPQRASIDPVNSVWWTWTAPTTAQFSLDTLGSSYDTLLSVFTGDAVDNLTLIGRNNNAFGRQQSQIAFDAVANTTYYFAIEGIFNDEGDLVLNLGAPGVPRAIDDFAITNVDQMLSGNVLADNRNGPDISPDGSALVVSEVNNVASDVGMPINLASGALLTVNADGTYTYDPNGQFDFLNPDETATDSFTYTVDNGNSTDIATATVTVFPSSVATPIGPEFQVNTFTSGDQDDANIAVDASGNFIVVWESSGQDGDGNGVFAQRYNADGTPDGTEFQVNTFTSNSQVNPKVTIDAEGNFIITWESFEQDGDDYGVFARRYNALGEPIDSEFQVNTVSFDDQEDPAVAMASDGSFIITWTSEEQDGDDDGVFAQRYNALGEPIDSEFQVNTVSFDDQRYAAIAIAPDRSFIITWTSDRQDGNSGGVFAQRYNADGIPNGSEFQVNTTSIGPQEYSTIAIAPSGNFIIAWESSGLDDDDIFAQRYNADGTPDGTEFQVNIPSNESRRRPQVTFDAEGNFVITWESGDQSGGADSIFARRYLADGTPDGTEFQVNTFNPDSQDAPAIAMTPSGDFIVAWDSLGQDGDGRGVYAQRFVIGERVQGQPTTIFVSSTNTVIGNAFQAGETYTGNLFSNTDLAFNINNDPNDIIAGTDGADNIWAGNEGNDLIDTAGGNDVIGISLGNVTVDAGTGDDFVYALGAGGGTNTVELGSGTDNFWAQGGNNIITGSDDNIIGIGTGNDTVTTSDGADFVYTVSDSGGTNVLNLGDGDNTIFVETGDYTITTGVGNDQIILGSGTDIVDAGDGNNIISMIDPNGGNDGVKDILTGSGMDFVQTGSGNDLIDAGTGLNTLFGAEGSDTFTFRSGAYNFIGDFEVGTDLIQLDGLIFEDLTFFQGVGDVAADVFLFVGNESIGQVANTTIAALNNTSNFV